jgi:type I restriction enzyme S subunit
MKNLTKEQVRSLRVLLPPLNEQREIAESLQSVDDAIAAGEAVISQLRCLRKSIHLELCTGRLGAQRPRQSGPWGEQPAEWRSALLGELVSIVRKPCTPMAGTPYVEIGVRSHGRGVFLKEAVDGSSLGSKRVFRVEPGCVVLNIVFAWEGAVAVTGEEHRGAIASHRFPMLRPVDGAADSRFLRHLLLTPPGLRILGIASPGGAGRNRTLNQGVLLKTRVPLPSLHEQQAIADALDDVDSRILAEDAVLEQRRCVKGSLADALLGGRLRVRVSV